MQDLQYDVVIIGLGPAGATLARSLGEKFTVLALDKKQDETTGFCKPCGGLLAPDAQKSLARFNLALPLEILVDPQIFSVRTIDVKTGLIRHYQRHYINLDRHRFDLWLRSKIPARVTVCIGALCQKITREENGYRVSYLHEGRQKTALARYIVGVDGANSLVRRTFFPSFKVRSYLSIQQWFENERATPLYACVFDQNSTDCYAWGLTKGEYYIFGGAFAAKTAKEDFAALKVKLKAYGLQLAAPLKTQACITLRPQPFQYCTGKDGVFLAGEAAGFISPSSLEGISYALESGYLLSRALPEKNPNKAYDKATYRIRCKLIAKNLKSIFMYKPSLRKWVMKSGLGSVEVRE